MRLKSFLFLFFISWIFIVFLVDVEVGVSEKGSTKKARKSEVKTAAKTEVKTKEKTQEKTEKVTTLVQAQVTPVSTPSNAILDANFNKSPTYIKADNLLLKSHERIFVYTGNVEVKQGEMVLTSDSLEGNYDESNEIKDLTAKANVIITKGDKIRAIGNNAYYEKNTETVTLTGSPELTQNESVLTADSIKIFLKEDRSTAEGQVRVKLVKEEDGSKEGGPLGRFGK